jgi:hypothetical protein
MDLMIDRVFQIRIPPENFVEANGQGSMLIPQASPRQALERKPKQKDRCCRWDSAGQA